MEPQELKIKYPDKQGFILFSHELKGVFRKYFNLEAEMSVHEQDSLEVSLGLTTIHTSQPDSPESVDIHEIAASLANQVRPSRPFEPEDLTFSRLKEQEIEKEWKHCLCSGE